MSSTTNTDADTDTDDVSDELPEHEHAYAADETGFYFDRQVRDFFNTFTLCRREYHSRGETGFFDITGKGTFIDLFINHLTLTSTNLLQNGFPDHDTTPAQNYINEVLGNYMQGNETVTIAFCHRNRFQHPYGIKITSEYHQHEDYTASFIRENTDEPLFGEPDLKQFDKMIGEVQTAMSENGTIGSVGEIDYTLALSIRNTKETIEFSLHATGCNRNIRDWTVDESSSWWNPL